MSGSPCIAYRADGTLCGEPATILDRLGLRYRDFMSWHHSGIWLGRAVRQPLGATPVLHRRRRVLRRPRGYVAETAIMHYIDASPDATPPDKLDVFDVLLANERIDVKGSLHPDLAGQVMPWLKGRWIGAYIFMYCDWPVLHHWIGVGPPAAPPRRVTIVGRCAMPTAGARWWRCARASVSHGAST